MLGLRVKEVAMAVSLETYRLAERRLAARESLFGLRAHAAITVVVCIGLVLLNVFVASGWSPSSSADSRSTRRASS